MYLRLLKDFWIIFLKTFYVLVLHEYGLRYLIQEVFKTLFER